MTFSENNSLLPGGSVSASEVKKLNEKIDDLSQTVTSVADSVAALSNEVNTSSLNASNAVIDNATIGSETVSSADITSAEIDSADITDADITNAEVNDLTADNASITDLTVSQAYANSVNSASFTGQSIHVSENIQSDKKLLGASVEATNAKFTDAEVTDLEIKGDSTVRGDVHFPENGDKIYGEYLDVEANNLQAKSLTTQTPSGSSQLVGYDANGKLIPVDASLDPANLWENDPDEENTIRPKDEKFIKTSGIIADEGDITELNCGDFASENVTADDVTITTSLSSEGSATFDSADVTNDATVGNDLTVGGDLDVDGDTTLDDTTVDGTLQVNGDIIQNGSAYETHAEKVYTKDDLIITRDGAVSALSQGDFTGIQATKYDGTHDGQLVFDNTGEARVGDVGDTEPLLTRDELANMTDARPLVWDGTNSKAVTGSSTQADALNSGITASGVSKLSGIEAGAQVNVQADWDQTDSTADDYIKNKPGLTVDVSLDPTSNNSVRNSAICAGLNMGGVCSTAKATRAKTVTIDGFVLQTGSRVTVMFTNGNSAYTAYNASLDSEKLTLNVSGTGAKEIKAVRSGAKLSLGNDENTGIEAAKTGYWRGAGTTSVEMWQPYTTLELLYDGTDWVIVGNPDVETYVDASGNGYGIKADGFIRQWGHYTYWANLNADENLKVYFSDTNYICLGTLMGNGVHSSSGSSLKLVPSTVSAFHVYSNSYYDDKITGFQWVIEGY